MTLAPAGEMFASSNVLCQDDFGWTDKDTEDPM